MRLTALALLLAAPALLLGRQDPDPKDLKAPKAREITVKGLPTSRDGQVAKPTKITDDAELKKAIPDDDARKEIAKQVNLKKEYLLLFQWSGSGQDKLTFETAKDGEVAFTHQRGLTRDFRMHARLFALPKGAKYKVGAGKVGGGLIKKKRDG